MSWVAYQRISAFLYWPWHCPPDISSITVNLSDVDWPSAARFASSVRNPGLVPLPDPSSFGNRGFRQYRRQAEEDGVEWNDRSATLRWRG
ncbi:MAG TPA: hypothetical protein VIZ90_20270 [Rhizobiaceae bacterium]